MPALGRSAQPPHCANLARGRGFTAPRRSEAGPAPPPLFTLTDDGTLHGQVPVDGCSWIAERTVDLPTLDGPLPLAMRREQRVNRRPGRGFPATRRGARGDAVAERLPAFPERFSADPQILLDQPAATGLTFPHLAG